MTDSTVPVAVSGISSIDVLAMKPSKKLTFFKVKLGNDTVCSCDASQGSDERHLAHNFTPSLALTNDFTVNVEYISTFPFAWKRNVNIKLNPREIKGKPEFRKSSKDIQVVIRSSSDVEASATDHNITGQLIPTTSDIFRICPRFRLLVMGKTGVGKSSLIHSAFGITGVNIEHGTRGEANIDAEFTSLENARFVLHDSQGFESGEGDRVKTVKDFIARRSDMPELKDRVHAIWLCLAAPHAEGRVFESGVEDFFKNKQEILGDIPVITVFTKRDLLDNRIEMEMEMRGEYGNKVIEAAKRQAIEERCIRPLKDVGGDNLSYAVVSAKEDTKSIASLIEITLADVQKYVATKGAGLTGKMAQRVNIDLKIDASISVGKKKYWRNLAASVDFEGQSLLDCLNVMHADIVAVWNFQDPGNYLNGEQFRKFMVEMVSNLEIPLSAESNTTLNLGVSVVASLAAILTPVAGPAMPMVVSVLTVAVFAGWASSVYQRTLDVTRRFMMYIVDLTLVAQVLFLLAPERVSMDDIHKAIQIYENAPGGKNQTHKKILNYSQTTITKAGRDHALQFIEKLIEDVSIGAGEVPGLRKEVAIIRGRIDH